MPPHPAVTAVTGVIVVASLALATAVAIYESPQARQFTEDLRRKIAIALHSLGDELSPESSSESPRFNRPEDAEGFLQSQGRRGSDARAHLDEDSQRRQRDELIYWNAVKIAQGKDEKSVENETSTYCTGDSRNLEIDQGLRNRGKRFQNLSRNGSLASTDPFSDIHNIETNPLFPAFSEPDIIQQRQITPESKFTSEAAASTGKVSNHDYESDELDSRARNTFGSMTIQAEKGVYTSIHAWAESASVRAESNPDKNTHETLVSSTPDLTYSSFGVNKLASSGESNHDIHTSHSGDVTPTDSGSIIGSEGTVWEQNYDVTSINGTMSLSGESNTPGNWSEIGSIVSEDDAAFN